MMLALAGIAIIAESSADDSYGFPSTIGGAISDWVLTAGVEMEVWSHSVTTPLGLQHGAYLNHFWSAGGKVRRARRLCTDTTRTASTDATTTTTTTNHTPPTTTPTTPTPTPRPSPSPPSTHTTTAVTAPA